jgi:ribonucleotide reductase alpha subunit
MPTASTSQIMNNYESFEVPIANIATRKTSVGLFKIVNKQLIDKLVSLDLWDLTMKNDIINEEGSIQNIDRIPIAIKNVYKTMYEIKQKVVMNHALARAPFVDQSQSMNLYFDKIDPAKTKGAMYYAWKQGLKTGSYYIHSKPASNAASVVTKSGNPTTPPSATDANDTSVTSVNVNPYAIDLSNKPSKKSNNGNCDIVAMKDGGCESCSA